MMLFLAGSSMGAASAPDAAIVVLSVTVLRVGMSLDKMTKT
jgi:hypothetical protein